MTSRTDSFLSPAWLLPESADISGQIESLDVDSDAGGEELRRILHHSLTSRQTAKLAAKFKTLNRAQQEKLQLANVKVLVLANATFQHLAEQLCVSALRHNLFLELKFTAFGEAARLAYQDDADTLSFQPDYIFHYQSPKDFGSGTAQDRFQDLIALSQKLAGAYSAVCIHNTLTEDIADYISDQDAAASGSNFSRIRAYNALLADGAQNNGYIVFDLARLAAMSGVWQWGEQTYWHLAKMPFHPDCNAVFANRFASLLAGLQGKSRRVLVLDCDNTLWGGVVGDDGLGGIEIGQGSAAGEAYLAVQNLALALKSKGVILAICSKNEMRTVQNVFETHEDMALRADDISIFKVNWQDKAHNIADIAQELNLGLQSFVFVDDNPLERDRVRRALPDIAVPEIGNNPVDYPGLILQAGYFNFAFESAEDQSRAKMYQENATRLHERAKFEDEDTYLQSLDMEAAFAPFNEAGRGRIAQLFAKTNQFNTAGIRYTLQQVQALEAAKDKLHMQVRLKDKFGDNGMVSALVVSKTSVETWHIDQWVMSCRVFGRRLEHVILDELVAHALAGGVKTLTADFKPTPRNGAIRDLFSSLGFENTGAANDVQMWRLSLPGYAPDPLPIRVVRQSL